MVHLVDGSDFLMFRLTGCSCCTTFAGSVLMSVRKRRWTNAKGEEKIAWVADYIDGKGIRWLKTFANKKDADGFAATAHVQGRLGTHVAGSARPQAQSQASFGSRVPKQPGSSVQRSTVTAHTSICTS
ncbi:hypothetical protein [Mesorhizobium sp. WSM2239]|uniref:Uncharacterized protein n=2 Tax=unclassified Mesorhizobium TaxID=325217 RepID=A0AAU8DGP5_9HYPH